MKIRTVKRTYSFHMMMRAGCILHIGRLNFPTCSFCARLAEIRNFYSLTLSRSPRTSSGPFFPKSDSCDIEAGVRRPVGVSMGLWRQIWHRNLKHKINLCLSFTNPNFTFHSKWYRNLNIFISFPYLKDEGPQPPLLLSEQHLGSE